MRGVDDYPITSLDIERMVTVHREQAYSWRRDAVYRDALIHAAWNEDARGVIRYVRERCAVHDALAREYLWLLMGWEKNDVGGTQ